MAPQAVRVPLFFRLLVLAVNSWAQQHNPAMEKIAKAYGIDSWDQVEAVCFAWNGEIVALIESRFLAECRELRAKYGRHLDSPIHSAQRKHSIREPSPSLKRKPVIG